MLRRNLLLHALCCYVSTLGMWYNHESYRDEPVPDQPDLAVYQPHRKLLTEPPPTPLIDCDDIPGLLSKQRRLCKRHPWIMGSVEDGVRIGVGECQRQFLNDRWNCTTHNRHGFENIVLKVGSREEAFAYAVTSAGIVYAIAHDCAQGKIGVCGCDQKRLTGKSTDPKGEFQWGGCSVDYKFARQLTRRFFGRDGAEHNAAIMMHNQNSKAGVRAVGRRLRRVCQCHGVSGACSVRTCWRSLPRFGDVGKLLKDKYDAALKVAVMPGASSPFLTGAVGVGAALNDYSRIYNDDRSISNTKLLRRVVRKLDLVYFEESPDYCSSRPEMGLPGTAGRVCNATSTGPDSCQQLCCGRGYESHLTLDEKKCNCRFIWCCNVQCETCREHRIVHQCKTEKSSRLQLLRSSR